MVAGLILLVVVGLPILVVTRRWFSPRPQEPSPRIQGHLASALGLWLLSWLVVWASHGRNGILLVIPPAWIIGTTAVAYRAAPDPTNQLDDPGR